MPFAAIWMKLEILILSKVSQQEKDKYNTVFLNFLAQLPWSLAMLEC